MGLDLKTGNATDFPQADSIYNEVEGNPQFISNFEVCENDNQTD